jgi:hypothetical protein
MNTEEYRPYPGGRAQAESGSRIIENDYAAWAVVRVRPGLLGDSHPLIRQLSLAWGAVSVRGLGDDAAAASIRYRVLSNAARSLTQAPAYAAERGRETGALLTLWRHALIHGHRLYATGQERFFAFGASGRYSAYVDAAAESANVEKHYQEWRDVSGFATGLADDVPLLDKVWADIDQRGLTDGAGAAAARYRALAVHAHAVADDVVQQLPSAALVPLLDLATCADKHAIRLDRTAVAIKGDTTDGLTAYLGLPARVAITAAQAHSETPHVGHAAPSATAHLASANRRTAQNQKDRLHDDVPDGSDPAQPARAECHGSTSGAF